MDSKSRWYVVTGGPSSGIDNVLRVLKKMGYPVIWEIARGVINRERRKGKTLEEIRKDEIGFQMSLLSIKAKLEEKLPRGKTFFLDRAMPDSDAYLESCGGDPEEARKLCERSLYKKIFLMARLTEFVQDGIRTEDKQTAGRISNLLKEAYERLGYEVILIPVMSPEARVNVILSHLDEEDLIQ